MNKGGFYDSYIKDLSIIETGVYNLTQSVKVDDGESKFLIVAEAIKLALLKTKRKTYNEALNKLRDELDKFIEFRIESLSSESFEISEEVLFKIIDKLVEYQAKRLSPYIHKDFDRLPINIREIIFNKIGDNDHKELVAKELWEELLNRLNISGLADSIDKERYSLNEEILKLYSKGIVELKENYGEDVVNKFPKSSKYKGNGMLGDLDVEIGVGGSNETIVSLSEAMDIMMDIPKSERELFNKINFNPLGRGDSSGERLSEYINEMVGEDASMLARLKALIALIEKLRIERVDDILGSNDEEIDINGLDFKVNDIQGIDSYSSHIRKRTRRLSKSEFAGLKNYQIGDSLKNIHLSKTSLNFTRKDILDLPLRHRDIYIKRFRSHISSDYVILFDKSHSMAGDKIYIAKNAISKFIKSIGKYYDDRLAFIEFDNNPSILWKFENVKRFSKRMLPFVSSISASGGTNIKNALKKGYELLKRSRSPLKHIILITDGRTIDVNCDDIVKRFRKMGVTLSSIGIGNDSDEKFLYHISNIGKGAYFKINNVNDLDKVLKLDHYLIR